MTTLQTSSRQILYSARWGATGFGIGLAIAGAVIGALNPYIQNSNTGLHVATLSYALAGSLGGATLALARNPQGNLYLFALVGAIGCGLGYFVTATLFSVYADERLSGYFAFTLALGIQFAVMGAFAGGMLGAVDKSWRQMSRSALAGAIGFGLYYLVLEVLFGSNPISALLPGSISDIAHTSLTLALTFAVWGAVGGAISGVCLGIANALSYQRPSPDA